MKEDLLPDGTMPVDSQLPEHFAPEIAEKEISAASPSPIVVEQPIIKKSDVASTIVPPTVPPTPTGAATNSAPAAPNQPSPDKKHRHLVLTLLIIAASIPLSLILYVLYWNYLPFGYAKTYTINAGSPNDMSGEFYLASSPNLSDRITNTAAGGNDAYREIVGPVNAIFKPSAVLKNKTLTAAIEGDGVALIPSFIDFDSSSASWDNSWNFNKTLPADLTGNASISNGCAVFNGTSTRLQMATSSNNQFENGPFSVYVEWKPATDPVINQEIIGHYNWELYQNGSSVLFQIGRVNDANGAFYTIKYPVKSDFFGKKHSALAIYAPASNVTDNGFIELYIDGTFVGRTYIGQDTIWADYGNSPLSFGWSEHNNGVSPYFNGCIYSANFANQQVLSSILSNISMPENGTAQLIISNEIATATIRTIILKVND